MSVTVCLFARTLSYPGGGGHLWVYLNWALGLRSLGCQVIWLEAVRPTFPVDKLKANLAVLKAHLERYGLAEWVAICSTDDDPLPRDAEDDCLDLNEAAEADLLLNLRYATNPKLVGAFRRSALIDIDPGLSQLWISSGKLLPAPHDVYFTIGETVGQPDAKFPDCGLEWHYTPPCVALNWWQPCPAAEDAPFTTVSHWTMGESINDGRDSYSNDKRTGFLPLLDLPQLTTRPLELALCLAQNEDHERVMLRQRGWRVRDAWTMTSTPWDYQLYIQNSRGEFSCAKPSCLRLQNAWISDRTICYLASGKPAVVQHTGSSRFLPDGDGLFRFHNLEEAARAIASVESAYEWHCRQARALAEEHFDAEKVVRRVLERALA